MIRGLYDSENEGYYAVIKILKGEFTLVGTIKIKNIFNKIYRTTKFHSSWNLKYNFLSLSFLWKDTAFENASGIVIEKVHFDCMLVQ